MSKRTTILMILSPLTLILAFALVDLQPVRSRVLVCLLFGVIGSLSLCSLLIDYRYRPQENHLGIIYRQGRFARFAAPDTYIVLMPGMDKVKRESNLGLRGATVTLQDELTADQALINVELSVGFTVDLREADPGSRTRALLIKEREWGTILASVAHDVAVNQVLANCRYEQLLTSEGREELKQRVSTQLNRRLGGLGVSVNPQHGITIKRLRPNALVEQALQNMLAAPLNGTAAAERLQPIIRELDQRHPGVAWESVLMSMASAIIDGAEMPEFMNTHVPATPIAYSQASTANNPFLHQRSNERNGHSSGSTPAGE